MMSVFQEAAAQAALPASETTRESWRLIEMPAPWVVVLVILPLVGLVAWLGYWRQPLANASSPGRARALLIGLRMASILVLLAVLFRPVKVQHQENVKPAEVVVLIDDSASMLRKDAYTGDSQARSTLRSKAGAPANEATRLELVQASVESALLPQLAARDYETRLFRFSDGFAPLAGLDSLAGRAHATHLGDALEEALAAHRGSHVTDVVVVSDGRSNGGTPPLDAARAAAAAGIPIHTVVVGDTRPEKNLIVELVEAPGSVLEGDEIAISVRVHTQGSPEETSTHLVLEELPAESSMDDFARTVAEERVDLSTDDTSLAGGDRVVLVAPPASVGLESAERRFRVSVPPLAGETLLDDNALIVSVRVTPEKIRVLYVDGYPRYEYRFLHRMLMRADERIQVQVWLGSATPDFRQESTKGMPALARVPTSRRELLENYDVVILGDVNPYAVSPDPAVGQEFVTSLFEFVERGGGLCLIAGEYENPKGIMNTEFENLLPVTLDPTGSLAFQSDSRAAFQPTLEDPANPHEIVRLHPELEVNRRLWEDPGGLAGLYWFLPVLDAKPGSQVLLRHPHESGPHGRYPLLVTGYYPSGRTMFLAIDSTWRWRFRYVDRYHERFWRNAVRWLALGRLKSGDRRYSLEPLRPTYGLDERATLEARILDEDFRPSEALDQEAFLERDGAQPEPLLLSRVEGRAGLFRSSFEADRPGLFRAWIEEEGERVASTEFQIVLPSRENADPSPDPATLAALSSMTGGRAVALASLSSLVQEFPGGEERREPISSQLKDAWDHWGTLLLALGFLSAEWVLRKRHELI